MNARSSFPLPPPQARLPFPYRDEIEVVQRALQSVQAGLDWPAVIATASPWVQAVRDKPAPFWAMESLLREYPISSAEGLALMRLAEALLRVPDAETAIALTADQLGRGEGARTEADAQRYLVSYRHAIEAIAAGRVAASPMAADGISIKLSALFSRYEDAQRERVFAQALPRVWTLIELAARANLNLTIDAEESDRLELSLDVLDALAARIAAQ